MASKRRRDRSANDRIEVDHYHYRIIAGQREGKCQAIAYVGWQRIDSVSGESVALAVETMKHSLDERLSLLRGQRANGVPSEAEYREGLLALSAATRDDTLRVLALHSRRPDAKMTLSALARVAGQEETQLTETYARLGRRLAKLLLFTPSSEEIEPALAPMASFALIESGSRKGAETLQLRAGVVDALQMFEDA